MIYIEQKTRIGLSKLNMITDYMYDIAKKYNGSFEEWPDRLRSIFLYKV